MSPQGKPLATESARGERSHESSAERLARDIAERNRERVGGALRALREIVLEHGYVSRPQEQVVAEVFNLSRAEVRGTVSFYHDLRTAPGPASEVRVCQAEACQAVGGRRFTKQVEARLGLRMGEANDTVALRTAYCLGLCAQGPAMMVDGRLVANGDLAALDILQGEAPRR